jgi:hypothetical protein
MYNGGCVLMLNPPRSRGIFEHALDLLKDLLKEIF